MKRHEASARLPERPPGPESSERNAQVSPGTHLGGRRVKPSEMQGDTATQVIPGEHTGTQEEHMG